MTRDELEKREKILDDAYLDALLLSKPYPQEAI